MSIMCVVLGIIFLIFGIVFAVWKEKAAILISGFNSMPKSEREKYNQAAMSEDMRNNLFLWAVIFVVGGILSHFVWSYFAIVAFVFWLILLSKEIHLDNEKAFGKYKL